MLVLSRKRNEEIVIGEDIVITVINIRYDKVRLGIECPINVPVHREEVYRAIQKEDEIVSKLGGHPEPDKPKEYINSQHYNPNMLCPNLDFDRKLNKLYDF